MPHDETRTPRRATPIASPPMRLTGGTFLALMAVLGLIVVAATDQVVPASSEHQADLRVWLTARAAGLLALALLTLQVALGLVLSHPTNKTTWRLSRRLFPWHENAWVFTLAFLAAHVVTIVIDEYADVGLLGAFVPGSSAYRSSAVALGTLALYALLITGLTARYTKRLPPGAWLKIHRIGVSVLALAWLHGLLAGTDSGAFAPFYGASFALVTLALAYRYWVGRQHRPSFASSLPEVSS